MGGMIRLHAVPLARLHDARCWVWHSLSGVAPWDQPARRLDKATLDDWREQRLPPARQAEVHGLLEQLRDDLLINDAEMSKRLCIWMLTLPMFDLWDEDTAGPMPNDQLIEDLLADLPRLDQEVCNRLVELLKPVVGNRLDDLRVWLNGCQGQYLVIEAIHDRWATQDYGSSA